MRKRSPIQCLWPLKMTKTSMTNKTETILRSESLASRFRPHGKKARETKLEKLKGNTSSSSSNLGDGKIFTSIDNVMFFKSSTICSYYLTVCPFIFY